MAEVDINDDSIKRFAIFHHRFDPETNHFKWVGIKAFDKKREWKKYLTKAGAELALKRASNEVSMKEHISGRILEAGSIKNNKAIRKLRRIPIVNSKDAVKNNKLFWCSAGRNHIQSTLLKRILSLLRF